MKNMAVKKIKSTSDDLQERRRHEAEKWKMWKEMMILYLDLAMKTEREKRQKILCIIDEEGRTVHRTWFFSKAQQDKVAPLLTKF